MVKFFYVSVQNHIRFRLSEGPSKTRVVNFQPSEVKISEGYIWEGSV